MADLILSNIATATGTYNGIPTALESIASVVILTNGLTITKTADKEVWATGDLTYTITVENVALYPFENPVLTDTLDPAIIKLIDGSVILNGEKTTNYTYHSTTGLLTLDLPTLPIGGTAVITFQVEKV